jgi:outer membrane protein assembly factor BamE (lipoprotein component of BamABCDE complex)
MDQNWGRGKIMAWSYLILVIGILTAGCGEQIMYQRFDRSMWSNYVHLNELKNGMTTVEVLGIMGPPGIKESGDYRSGHYNVYFYLTHSMDFDESNTVRNGYTPLVFKSDKLVGIGKRDYRQAVDRPEAVGVPAGNLPWSRTQ